MEGFYFDECTHKNKILSNDNRSLEFGDMDGVSLAHIATVRPCIRWGETAIFRIRLDFPPVDNAVNTIGIAPASRSLSGRSSFWVTNFFLCRLRYSAKVLVYSLPEHDYQTEAMIKENMPEILSKLDVLGLKVDATDEENSGIVIVSAFCNDKAVIENQKINLKSELQNEDCCKFGCYINQKKTRVTIVGNSSLVSLCKSFIKENNITL